MDNTRRKITLGILSAPALSTVTIGSLAGCNDSNTNPISDEDFQHIITQRLSQELNDKNTAAQLVPFISEAIFNMMPPTKSIEHADVLIGFAFGNRPNQSGDPNELAEPGPMNEDLAVRCAEIYRQKPIKMYVQWEIARFLDSESYPDIPTKDIISIEPYWDNEGKLIYLSTEGVIQSIINNHFDGDPTAVGSAVVVGHRDHIKRCITICEMNGISGYSPQEVAMPSWYDEQSHQPWTRRRDLYVLQDMSAQMMMMAQANINQAHHSQNEIGDK